MNFPNYDITLLVDEVIRDVPVTVTDSPMAGSVLAAMGAPPLVVLRHPQGRSEAQEPRSGLTRYRSHDIASDDAGAM